MPQTCGQCGATLAGDAVFCSACGSQVGKGGPGAGGHRPSAETIATGEQRLLKTLREATLGEYEILNEIGRGGMAVVFLGHDIALNRRVAIKCMAPALMLMDKGIQERFKREARTAAGLSHPHIIPVYAVKEERDLVFFVMKYIEGRSLESVIKEVGPLPIPVIQTILNQAGSALGYAHRNGVVHRDVKPGNIMLDQDGWLVMTDFGIAKVAQAEALTMTGGMVGTPAYMSPEQCKGDSVTGAADQYSLGVVAYEMLTGKPPFSSPTMVNMIYDHCHTLPPPLAGQREDAPPELTAAVMRMLEKEPGIRFPTIEDAVAAVGVASETQDVVRTRILTLVQSSATAKLLDKFRSPGSPVPNPRFGSPAPLSQMTPGGPVTPATPAPHGATPAPGAPSRGRLAPWAWAVPAAAAVAASIFVLGRRSSDVPSGTAPATPPVAEAPAVVTRLDVTPVSLALAVGAESALIAAPRDASGSPVGAAVTWEALDPGVASVSATGVVRGVTAGQGRVVARSGGSSASVVITVTAPPPPAAARTAAPAAVASVSVAPAALALQVGESARLTAFPMAADGGSLRDRRVTWTASDSRVATVNQDGQVTAVGPGTGSIVAATEGRSSAVSVTVTAAAPVAVATVTVEPPSLTLAAGAEQRLRAAARDARGAVMSDRPVTWRSSTPSVASVDGDGNVVALGPG
ncbi:MAG TPA: protein kinase, partial [Gemmatimonadales bacterium]|nr:protein kinase [Gemmatimonadales bacterium]